MKSLEVLDAAEVVVAGLSAQAGFPALNRNANLDDVFEALEGDACAYVNMVDGDLTELDQALGADLGAYELSQGFLIELIAAAPSDPERREALAGMVRLIGEQLVADPTLNGACDYCQLTGLRRLEQATEGVPGVTGWTLECAATFYSDRRY